jgi:hypothetical protein
MLKKGTIAEEEAGGVRSERKPHNKQGMETLSGFRLYFWALCLVSSRFCLNPLFDPCFIFLSVVSTLGHIKHLENSRPF